jgi:hypothetical protein
MPERKSQLRPRHNLVEAIIGDGTHHLLTPSILDVLLENSQVIKIKRSIGWETVGIGPIQIQE